MESNETHTVSESKSQSCTETEEAISIISEEPEEMSLNTYEKK